MPVLFRYIASEIFSPFLVSLFIFTGILFLFRSLKLFDLVVNKSVSVVDILLLFSYVIPRFLELAIPMALLLGTLTAFGRLSADSELVVMRATGVSLRQIAKPVVAFAIASTLLAFVIVLWVSPAANFRLGRGMFEIARTQASAGLITGTFNDFGALTIYAERSTDKGENLQNVVIGDRRDPEAVKRFVAKHGQVLSDEASRTITIRLYDGSIHEGSGLNSVVTFFDINNITIGIDDLIEDNPTKEGKKADEMFTGELLSAARHLEQSPEGQTKEGRSQLARYTTEFHRRFALPFACLCVALVAMALGVQPSRRNHTWGLAMNVIVGIIVITVYYLLLAVGSALSGDGAIPAGVAMWLPNIFFIGIAWFLFRRMESEEWLSASTSFGDKIGHLLNRVGMFKYQKSDEE